MVVVVVVVVSVLYHYIAIGLTNVHFTGDYTAIQTHRLTLTSVSGELTGAEKCINNNVRDERYIISYLHTIVYCAITSLDVFLEKYNKDYRII